MQQRASSRRKLQPTRLQRWRTCARWHSRKTPRTSRWALGGFTNQGVTGQLGSGSCSFSTIVLRRGSHGEENQGRSGLQVINGLWSRLKQLRQSMVPDLGHTTCDTTNDTTTSAGLGLAQGSQVLETSTQLDNEFQCVAKADNPLCRVFTATMTPVLTLFHLSKVRIRSRQPTRRSPRRTLCFPA